MQAQSQGNRTVGFLLPLNTNMDFPLPSVYSVDFHHYEVTVLFLPLRAIKPKKSFWEGGHRAPKTMQNVTAFPRQGFQGNLADYQRDKSSFPQMDEWCLCCSAYNRTAHLRHLAAAVCGHACSWGTATKYWRGWTEQLQKGKSHSPERPEGRKEKSLQFK